MPVSKNKRKKKHRSPSSPSSRQRQRVTQVNTLDGIQTWRECGTCQQLLTKHRKQFEGVCDDGVCHEFCVADMLVKGQTPEYLLHFLNTKDSN